MWVLGEGDPVDMFTGRVCLSLMARTTTTMENRKAMMIAPKEVLFYDDRAYEEKRR